MLPVTVRPLLLPVLLAAIAWSRAFRGREGGKTGLTTDLDEKEEEENKE